MSLGENRTNTSTGSIHLYDKFPFRVWVMQDGSRGESFLEFQKGGNGCRGPLEMLSPLLEHSGHGRCDRAEVADESPIEIGKAQEAL